MTLGIISLVRLSAPGGDAMLVVFVACRIGLIRAESDFGPSIDRGDDGQAQWPNWDCGKVSRMKK